MYFDRVVSTIDEEPFEIPRVIDTAREWRVVNRTASGSLAAGAAVPCFVAPGARGYCYIYRVSNLRYILTLYNGKPRLARYVGAPPESPDIGRDIVNHGDHLTFGFIKNSEALRVRTHMTTYTEPAGPPGTFIRNMMGECNFDMSPTGVSEAEAAVANPLCYSANKNVPPFTLTDTYSYDPLAVDIIRSLMKVITGVPLEPTEQVNVGTRGGRYRLSPSGAKRYIRQAGGAGEPVSYKDITFFNERFARFLSARIIRHVRDARRDLESVRVFFDEGNYFGPTGNKYIVMAYDFSESECAVFYVNAKTAMVACYADAQPEEELTSYERTCLRDFRSATLPERVRPPILIMGGRRAARRAAGREKRAVSERKAGAAAPA